MGSVLSLDIEIHYEAVDIPARALAVAYSCLEWSRLAYEGQSGEGLERLT